MAKRAPCGTVRGYWRHGREGTPPCPRCRKAMSTYRSERRQANPDSHRKAVQRWRAKTPSYYERKRKSEAARNRALVKLSKMFPDDFSRLLRRERKQEGLD